MKNLGLFSFFFFLGRGGIIKALAEHILNEGLSLCIVEIHNAIADKIQEKMTVST